MISCKICCNCVTIYLTRKWHHVLSAWSPHPSILNGKDNTGQKQWSPWASMLIDFPRSPRRSLICMQTTSMWIFGFPHHSNRAAKPCCTTSHQTQSCLGIAQHAGARRKGDKKRKEKGRAHRCLAPNSLWEFSSLGPWQLSYNGSKVPRVIITAGGQAFIPALSWETNGGMQKCHSSLTMTEPLYTESFCVRLRSSAG